MSKTSPNGYWRAGGASARGPTHVRRKLPNQDAISWATVGGWTILAVSDGHGSAPHFRSDRGSRFACEVAVQTLSEIANGAWDEQELADATHRLPDILIERWRMRVEADMAEDPIEPGALPADPLDRYNPYGATLLAAGHGPDGAIYCQIGDGDLLVGRPGQPLTRLLGSDEGLIGEATYSLCLADAARYFRVRRVTMSDPAHDADFVMMSTDGLSKSFTDDEAFFAVAASYRTRVGEVGLDNILDDLATWLFHCAERGSGDDTTLGFLVPAAVPTGVKPGGPPIRIEDDNFVSTKLISAGRPLAESAAARAPRHAGAGGAGSMAIPVAPGTGSDDITLPVAPPAGALLPAPAPHADVTEPIERPIPAAPPVPRGDHSATEIAGAPRRPDGQPTIMRGIDDKTVPIDKAAVGAPQPPAAPPRPSVLDAPRPAPDGRRGMMWLLVVVLGAVVAAVLIWMTLKRDTARPTGNTPTEAPSTPDTAPAPQAPAPAPQVPAAPPPATQRPSTEPPRPAAPGSGPVEQRSEPPPVAPGTPPAAAPHQAPRAAPPPSRGPAPSAPQRAPEGGSPSPSQEPPPGSRPLRSDEQRVNKDFGRLPADREIAFAARIL